MENTDLGHLQNFKWIVLMKKIDWFHECNLLGSARSMSVCILSELDVAGLLSASALNWLNQSIMSVLKLY